MKEEKRCLNTYGCYGKPTIILTYRVGNETKTTDNFCSEECRLKYRGEYKNKTKHSDISKRDEFLPEPEDMLVELDGRVYIYDIWDRKLYLYKLGRGLVDERKPGILIHSEKNGYVRILLDTIEDLKDGKRKISEIPRPKLEPVESLYWCFNKRYPIDPNKLTWKLVRKCNDKLNLGWYQKILKTSEKVEEGILYQLKHYENWVDYEFPEIKNFNYLWLLPDKLDDVYLSIPLLYRLYLIWETYQEEYNPNYKPEVIRKDVLTVKGNVVKINKEIKSYRRE
jgi:hypothetical protein